MDQRKLKDLYFDWIASLAFPDIRLRRRYEKLLFALDDSIFHFTIPLDENRKVDGLQLRHRFAYENSIPTTLVDSYLNNKECSMLEMMIALALRGEEHIMHDPEIGDQLGNWFFEMIKSMQLEGMTNENFDPEWIIFRIDTLLNHNYEPNGHGGLFTINNPRKDMRHVEIWYQMCWYLDAILKE